MLRFRLPGRSLALALGLVVLLAGQAQAQSRAASEVLERVRAAYAATDALRAAFTQEVAGARLEGTLLLQGDRYRIETADQVLVSDGRTAWAYSRPDNQVLISRVDDDALALSPNAFFTRYPDEFHVQVRGTETLGGVRHDVLHLTPRQRNAFVREVTLHVRSSDGMPTRARVVDGNGTVMTFTLRNLERNPRLAADAFRFTPPPGAEVVDLR